MESSVTDSEVRLTVARCLRSLSSSSDTEDTVAALQTLQSYLNDGPESETPAAQRAEFRRAHYTRTLQCLVSNIQADWVHSLKAAQRVELWDALFLKGPPEQALLVLMQAVQELRWVLLKRRQFLQRGRLTELLWSYCSDAAPPDSPQFRETLLGRISALPDIVANKLQRGSRGLFLPQQYYPLLGNSKFASVYRCLCRLVCDFYFQSVDGLVLAVLAPRLSAASRSDMVWQRVCWKLVENVPQRWMESVLTELLQAVAGPEALGRIIGNLVLTNKKAQFVIIHKILLLQYKYETRVLRSVLGYLAADRERRPLLLQVVRSVSQAWANPSAVKHTPLEQQLYVSKALLLSVSLLKDAERQELRSELLQCMLGGMQSHLDSGVPRIRRMGMVVGECLSSCMDISGARLKFEYDQDEETRELLSLMTPVACDEPEPEPVNGYESNTSVTPKITSECEVESTRLYASLSLFCLVLFSDDELTPYDMSADQEINQASPPRYLRDCLESLVSSEDPLRVELSLRVCESLVRRNVFAAREISVQMSKVLLHMENKYNIGGFPGLRHAAMVALTATDCIPVTQYLTTEFYSLNYSLRQRLDILEVLAAAAQELSRPITERRDPARDAEAASAGPAPYPGDSPEHWRQVVEKRIRSKTKVLSKGAKRPLIQASPNRYAAVAGHFFFPLLRNYDKPQVTFDLLGSDQLVLGRFIHTLGLLMHLAVNAPVASVTSAPRYRIVVLLRMVRRGVLFSVCSVFVSMPSQSLLLDLSERLFETRAWLAGKQNTLLGGQTRDSLNCNRKKGRFC
uniref:Telomere length regulation protein TEL2 homolog n=1 Tax=Salarias fasciatus TaxID=181472 RepID=A0A672FUW4_SALFA